MSEEMVRMRFVFEGGATLDVPLLACHVGMTIELINQARSSPDDFTRAPSISSRHGMFVDLSKVVGCCVLGGSLAQPIPQDDLRCSLPRNRA